MRRGPKRPFDRRGEGITTGRAGAGEVRGRRGGLAVAALIVGLAASPAQAAPAPLSVGPGEKPNVAIDGAGTAHVAWNSTDDLKLRYCRLPPGATGCPAVQEVALPDDASARPYPFLDGVGVRILTNRCCTSGSRTLLFTSTDGGQSFTSRTVGDLNPSGDAALGPGNGISVVTSELTSTFFQRVPTDASTPAVTAKPTLSTHYLYDGSVGLFQGRPVVTFNDLTNTAFTVNNGADPNDGSNWSAPSLVGPGTDGHLASGPAGLFLLLRSGNGDSGHLEVRAFDGTGFTPPVAIPGSVGRTAAIAEDPTGRLHVVWVAGGGNPTDLLYSSSSDGGAHWSSPLAAATDQGIFELRTAVGADGKGIAVWKDTTAADSSVRAVSLPPAPPAPPPPTPRAGADPQAIFTASPNPPCQGETITFDASASAGGNPIVEYDWTARSVAGYVASNSFPSTSATPILSARFGASSVREFSTSSAWGDEVHRDPVDVTLEVVDSAGRRTTSTQRITWINPIVRVGVSTLQPTVTWPSFGSGAATTPERENDCRNYALFETPATQIRSSVARLSANSISLALGCPAGPTSCIGAVELRRTGGAAGAHSAARTKHRKRRRTAKPIGFGAYAVDPGQTATVNVALNRRGRALARRHKLSRVVVRLSHVGANGKTTRETKTLKVQARVRKKHRQR
jgi:hypothetical protein